jgi:D-Tyr-tRNAtyr deacylase
VSIGFKIKVFGTARGRRPQCNTATTGNTARNLYLKSHNDT